MRTHTTIYMIKLKKRISMTYFEKEIEEDKLQLIIKGTLPPNSKNSEK